MVSNPYQSPCVAPADLAGPPQPRLLPRGARIGIFVAIWGGAWVVSVLVFWGQMGFLPHDAGSLLLAPVITSFITLPLSFASAIRKLSCWLPAPVSNMLALCGGIGFWPCYIMLSVLWFRRGKQGYCVPLGIITVLASLYWHVLTFNGCMQ